MIDSIRRTIQKFHLIPSHTTLVVGVSGGADSLTLLHLLYTLQSTLECQLHVATLDHGLRGKAGTADAEYVRTIAEQLSLPVTVGHADARQVAAAERIGIEAAARIVRYEFLAKVAGQVGAERVAVAHHAGDQAETVLMHLLRGAGLAGLGGMAMATPMPGYPHLTLIRPLLWNTRIEIEAYCKPQGLTPREDATNQDTSYLRNRLRLNILPDLEQINPHVQRALVQAGDIMRVENDYIQGQLEKVVSGGAVHKNESGIMIGREAFRGLHPALQRRLIAWAAGAVKPVEELDYLHIVDAVAMGIEGKQGGRALLTDGLQLRVDYDVLVIERQDAPMPDDYHVLLPEKFSLHLEIPSVVEIPGSQWSLQVALDIPYNVLPLGQLSIPQGLMLTLRTCHEGDVFAPMGMNGHHQRLNRWMINRKVSRNIRERIPLICAGDEIVAIYAKAQWYVSDSSSVKDNSPRIVYFHFLQNL